MTFIIGSTVTADFCAGSPDDKVLALWNRVAQRNSSTPGPNGTWLQPPWLLNDLVVQALFACPTDSTIYALQSNTTGLNGPYNSNYDIQTILDDRIWLLATLLPAMTRFLVLINNAPSPAFIASSCGKNNNFATLQATAESLNYQLCLSTQSLVRLFLACFSWERTVMMRDER